MYPSPFEYVSVDSVSEAISQLQDLEDAELLAGGQSLIPLQKMRLAAPDYVIDMNGIEELEYIEDGDSVVRVGALARHTAIERHPSVRERVFLFSECISQIADQQVRNQGTMGGTVAEADPSGDYFPPLKLLNPEIVIEGPDGERTVDFEEFYIGMFTVDLDDRELLTEVRLPKLTPASGAVSVGSAYEKHAERSGDYAIVGEAAIVHVDDDGTIVDANLAVGAVGPLFRAEAAEDVVEGTTLGEDTLAEVETIVSEAATPDEGGVEGEYKKSMAGTFAKRALQSAYDRALEAQ